MAMANKYVYKISSRYLQEWLSYDIKHVEKNQICPFSLDFPIFIFWPSLIFQKVFLGHFACSLRKVDVKTCITVSYHDFLGGLAFFTGWPEMTLTCIMFKLSAKNCLRWSQRTYIPNFTHWYNGAERNHNLYTNSLRTYTISQCVAVLWLRFFLSWKGSAILFYMFNDDVMTHIWC